ncbi:MAG: alpha/beta fold hydrolase [Myxococcota bacterium]
MADGATAEARLFVGGEAAPGLLVLPAMGVNARSYDRLGEQLASEGVTTLVAEHRGGDSSSVRPRRGVDFGYAELLDDLVLHLEQLERRTRGPVSVLGHSLGGQLATIGLARWWKPGARLVVIASGTVHHRAWTGLERLGVLAGTQLAHAVARGLGYFPGHRLGFGGLQARSLIADWSFAARTGEFRSHSRGQLEQRLDELAPSVLALHVQGDTMAPRAATEGLLRKVRNAKVTWLDITPPPTPAKMNAHFRWMKDPSRVAREVAVFLRTGTH